MNDPLEIVYPWGLALVGALFVLAAVRLAIVRRPLLIPGWSITWLVGIPLFVPWAAMAAVRPMLNRHWLTASLGVLLNLGVLVYIHYQNRGYHVLGRSLAGVSSTWRLLVDRGRLEATQDERVFKLPAPDGEVRLELTDYPGDVQMRIRPWARRRLVTPLIRELCDHYKTHPTPNSRASEGALVIFGVITLSLSYLMFINR